MGWGLLGPGGLCNGLLSKDTWADLPEGAGRVVSCTALRPGGLQTGNRGGSPDTPRRRRRAERPAADTASAGLRAGTTGRPSVWA